MKSLQRFTGAVLLALAIGFSVRAGQVDGPPAPEPPPPTGESLVSGSPSYASGQVDSPPTAEDLLAALAAGALQSILPLL